MPCRPKLRGLCHATSRYLLCFFVLFETISRHRNCFLPSVVKNGKDGHGVQLVKVGLLMLCLQKSPKNIMVSALR